MSVAWRGKYAISSWRLIWSRRVPSDVLQANGRPGRTIRLWMICVCLRAVRYCVRIEPGRDLTTRVCRLAAQHQATRNPCSELGASLGQLRYLKFLKFYREGFLKAGAGPGGAPGPTAVTILRVSDRNRRIPRGSLSRALAAVPPASQPTVAGRYHDRSHGGRLC